ncbi:MAG: sugar ABC transporter permease [Eubacterium sp.]|jgi:putative aldouronate transport system permease protein|nr:sugar ABC transporter permease [Eubacterium sp.]
MAKVNQKDTIDYDSIVVREPSVFERMWQYRYFYLMFIPVALVLFIFFYWPMLGVRYAFSTYKLKQITLRLGPDYSTGLGNFKRLFGADPFIGALRNTLVLSIVNLILATVLTVVIALLLNELQHQWSKKIVQTVLYLPHFLSWVVAASIFMLILSAGTDATGQDTANMGFINALLCKVGILDKPIDFLTESKCWRSVWYIMNRWKETGWGTIIYLAALSGISPDLYEAAEIDGANRLQQIWNITIPAIMNTILVVFILNLAKVMNVFESVFVLYNSLVYDVSDVIQTYTYRVGIVGNDYGYSTAIGLFKSVISLILVTASDVISKKVRGYGIV